MVGPHALLSTMVLLLSAEFLWADGYADALGVVGAMRQTSDAALEAVVVAHGQGQFAQAASYSSATAVRMKAQADAIWAIYVREPTLALQSLYLAADNLTQLWLAELAVFQLSARGLFDIAGTKIELAQLCDRTYSAALQAAQKYRAAGL